MWDKLFGKQNPVDPNYFNPYDERNLLGVLGGGYGPTQYPQQDDGIDWNFMGDIGTKLLQSSGWHAGPAPTLGEALGHGMEYATKQKGIRQNSEQDRMAQNMMIQQQAQKFNLDSRKAQMEGLLGDMLANGADPRSPEVMGLLSKLDPTASLDLMLQGQPAPGPFGGMKENEWKATILDKVQRNQLDGSPLSKDDVLAYQRIMADEMKPKTIVDEFGKVQTVQGAGLPGFPSVEELLQSQGLVPQQEQPQVSGVLGQLSGSAMGPVDGVSTRKASTEEAGKFTLNVLGRDAISRIESDLLDEDGNPKPHMVRGLAALSKVGSEGQDSGVIGNIVKEGTKGVTSAVDPQINKTYLDMRQTGEGMIRTATGAAMAESEVKDYANRFLPDTGDVVSPDILKHRLALMKDFAQLATEVTTGGIPVLSKQQLDQWFEQRAQKYNEEKGNSALKAVEEKQGKRRKYNPETGRIE